MHKHIKVTYFDNNPICYCNGEKANEEEIINCLVESFEEKGNLVKKIRELKKENEELKTFLEAMREELSLADRDNTALEKENEELKQDCKNYIWYKQVKTLTNENEELKRQKNDLKETLKEINMMSDV